MRHVLILMAAVTLTTAARADDAAEKVVKRAVEAHGGEKALAKIKAADSTLKATIDIGGQDAEFEGEASFALPGKMRVSLKGEVMGQKIEIVQTLNGDKARLTLNGMPMDLSDAQKAEMKEGLVGQEIGLIAPLLDKKRFTLTAETDEKVNGADAAVVRVAAKGMKDVKLFFDKKTHLLARVQRQGLSQAGEEVDAVSDLSDYKKADGILSPTTVKVSHDGKAFMTLKVSDVRHLEKPDDVKKFTIDDK